MMNKKYLIAFITAFLFFLVLIILAPKSQLAVFFNSCGDFGADYFNICRYVADMDPYGNTLNGPTEHSGFPLGYLLYYFFSLTADYSSMTLQDCWHEKVGCIIPFIIYSLFNFSVFVFSIYEYSKQYTIKNKFLIPIFLSSIVLFTLERGNSILLIAGLINLFLVYYQSDKRYKKILAILFLSFAGIQKIVPGLFCILYLKDKRYKEFFALAIITILLTFLPFLCFKGGFSNVMLIPERMALQVDVYGLNPSCYRFGFMSIASQIYMHWKNDGLLSVCKIIPYVLLVLSIIMFFINKEHKRAELYLLFVLALFAGSANVYNDLYLFPLFIYTLASKDTKEKVVLLVLYFFIMQPIQINSHGISYIIANICSIILWFYVLISDMRKKCVKNN